MARSRDLEEGEFANSRREKKSKKEKKSRREDKYFKESNDHRATPHDVILANKNGNLEYRQASDNDDELEEFNNSRKSKKDRYKRRLKETSYYSGSASSESSFAKDLCALSVLVLIFAIVGIILLDQCHMLPRCVEDNCCLGRNVLDKGVEEPEELKEYRNKSAADHGKETMGECGQHIQHITRSPIYLAACYMCMNLGENLFWEGTTVCQINRVLNLLGFLLFIIGYLLDLRGQQ